MDLYAWAQQWSIPPQAIHALRDALCARAPDAFAGASEAAVQSRVRLEASRKGVTLFRNQVGAMYDERGNFVRFGLANDSAQLNSRIKSADLIGMRPIVITAEMVGRTVGQFVSRECKRGDWSFTGDEHELAQLAWAAFVTSMGGDAAIVNGEGTL